MTKLEIFEQHINERRPLKKIIYMDEIWVLEAYLGFRVDVPYLEYEARFNYKNGQKGRSRFSFIINKGQLTLWEVDPTVQVRKDLLEKAEKFTIDIMSSKAFKKKNVTLYEAYSCLIRDIFYNRVDLLHCSNAEQVKQVMQNSVDKLLGEVETRHIGCNKVYIKDTITNIYYHLILRGIEQQKEVPIQIREEVEYSKDLVEKVNALKPYLKTVSSYEICRYPVGYVIEIKGEYTSKILSTSGWINEERKLTGTVVLNKLSTILLMSNPELTGKIKNGRLEQWGEVDYSTTINYLNSIFPGSLELNFPKNLDIIDVASRINISDFVDTYDYNIKIKELLKIRKPQDNGSVTGLFSRFNRKSPFA